MKDWWYKMSLTEKQIYDLNNMNVSAQKAQLGDILSTGGQADWNQNDETAPDYIKNRPFYDETVIEWDGNTEGKTVVPVGNDLSFVRISNMTPTKEDLIGAKITLSTGDSSTLQESNMAENDNLIVEINHFSFFIAKENNVSFERRIFPKAGLYFSYINEHNYINSITFGSLKQIDKKFLPETRVIFTEDHDGNITCNTPYDELALLLSDGVPVSGVFRSRREDLCSQILYFYQGVDGIRFGCYTSGKTIKDFTYNESGIHDGPV